jgi:hypothetical protein
MRNGILWAIVPDAALPLLFLLAGLMLVLGFRRMALGLLLSLILMALLSPLIESLFSALPLWISTLLLIVIGFWLLRGVVSLILGARATDHVVGILAADVIRMIFRMMFWPLRLLTEMLRRR